MAGATIADKYANKAFGTVVESAANTLTFHEIQTNVEVFSKRAWIVSRIEWFISGTELQKIAAADDKIQLALVASNAISALTLDNPAVIDLMEIMLWFSTAVGYVPIIDPIARDFSQLPGGGLIIAPRPLYLAAKGTSLATAVTASMRFYFQVLDLTADNYLELVDFYRIVQ